MKTAMIALMAILLSGCGTRDLSSGSKWIVHSKEMSPSGIWYTIHEFKNSGGSGYTEFNLYMSYDPFQLGDEITVCKKQ